MAHIISPYDRKGDDGGPSAGFIAIVASVVLHIGALVAFLVLSELHNVRVQPNNVIYVELLGATAPRASAAPSSLEVDPDQQGPDVREAPRSTPEPPAQVTPEAVKPLTAPADDVIPLKKPETPEKPPEIKKTPEKPPQATPPKVEPPKPKPKPKPKQNLDSDIEKKMAELKRKRAAAEDADDDVDDRMWDLDRDRGRGEGESSESGGSTRGTRVDPEQERYYRHIRDIISHNWLAPSDVSSIDLVTSYVIVIQPSGQVSRSTMVKSSKHDSYDLSVERAVKSSSPFPPLPAAFGGAAISIQLDFSLNELRRGR